VGGERIGKIKKNLEITKKTSIPLEKNNNVIRPQPGKEGAKRREKERGKEKQKLKGLLSFH